MAAPEIHRCPDARRGLRYYRFWEREWQRKMARSHSARLINGKPVVATTGTRGSPGRPRSYSCSWTRRAVSLVRTRAVQARHAYEQWWLDNYAWPTWLPPVWVAIARCETHLNWKHDSGTYQGAFGFHHSSWDAFRLPGYPSEAYEATPREQFNVALAIYRRFGFSGWGCA